ncbi:hypothetical protein [Leisingera aquimarina]|uniref:hypothetical protein n=1 Tax=Leisingera aquimarina TaxID=476529 RepID=UPI0003F70D39|nr:hypothetical protein [Leisingera aquimarina]
MGLVAQPVKKTMNSSKEISFFNKQAPSRAGDRYHYVRTARLCLEMLRPGSRLQKVVVEGTSPDDVSTGGEDVIDLALYHGDAGQEAEKIVYRQFKHSLTAPDKEMTASDLVKTLIGYAKRFPSAEREETLSKCGLKHEFQFETNRPISELVVTALTELQSGETSKNADYFREKLPLNAKQIKRFAERVKLLPSTPSLATQSKLLQEDSRSYLPDVDRDVPIRLVEMVANKAAKPDQPDLVIDRNDVLRIMDCLEHDLLPAPTELDTPEDFIARTVFEEITQKIVESDVPILLEAEGGSGKSVAAAALHRFLPEGSVSVLFDCFASGSYRQISRLRHEPRHGFVQMANELAFQGLCDPIIPSPKATGEAYARVFEARLKQAAASVVQASQGAVILLVIDAADNAEIAARENGHAASFPRSMLRMEWPKGVKVVLTTRPERKHLLDPPPSPRTRELPLDSFSEIETGAYLRNRFPDANDAAVSSFHRLTSANPRLQYKALEGTGSLNQVLDRLGPLPRTVQEAIEAILEQAISVARDAAGAEEKQTIDRMCEALAVLRPFIPVEVLAAVSGASVHFVRTFSSELGKALVINDEAVQFIDEPTEHWFQTRFLPTTDNSRQLANVVRSLSKTSIYASITLPRLLLASGQLDELIEMNLSDGGLPEGGDVSRREIQLQRLRTSVQAALRAKRYSDAAKLAFKAAGLAAAEDRQLSVISSNPDIASVFLEPAQTADLVANRKIGGGEWFGSDNAYQAALFAGYEQFRGDAFSRLYAANNWLDDHLEKRRENENTSFDRVNFDNEITEMAWAIFQLDGADRCARFLRSWTPRSISFNFGRVVASRLADAGRIDDLDALLSAAGNDVFLASAVNLEMLRVNRFPDKGQIARLARILSSERVDLGTLGDDNLSDFRESPYLSAIVSICVAAIRARALPRKEVSRLLSRYLPKHLDHEISGHWHEAYGTRCTLLRGFALRAALNGRPLTVGRLLKKETRKTSVDRTDDRRRTAGSLIPWYRLWANSILGRISPSELSDKVEETTKEAAKAKGGYFERRDDTFDEVSVLKAEILTLLNASTEVWGHAESWHRHKEKQVLKPNTALRLVRLLSQRTELHGFALDLCRLSTDCYAKWREGAESRVEVYVSMARAVLGISLEEAKALFNLAAKEAEMLGEENHDRWNTILSIGQHAGSEPSEAPKLAYKLARFAEPTYEHMAKYSYLDWERTMRVLSRLSPRSVLAIASRWADREFGAVDREIHYALDELWRSGHIKGDLLLAMFPAHGHGAKGAIEAGLTAGCVDAFKELVIRYLSTSAPSHTQLKFVNKKAGELGIKFDWIEAAIQSAKARNADRYFSPQNEDRDKPEHNWQETLADLNLTDPEDLQTARARINEEKSIGRKNTWDILVPLVPAGKEARFLASVSTLIDFGYWELRELLARVPESWCGRASFLPAMKALVLRSFEIDPFRPGLWGWYEGNPFSDLAKTAGISAGELARHVLKVISEFDDPLYSGDFFHLSALAARSIEPVDAAEVLEFALEQMDFAMEAEDGDGPWSTSLEPPSTATDSAIGFLWSALGSPDPSRRWRATHATRRVLEWCDDSYLEKLVAYAKRGEASAFQDARLPFYRLHANEWLLIALERVALDSPERLFAAKKWLFEMAAPGEHHVANRGRAAKILLAMHEAGCIALDISETERLTTINEDRTGKGAIDVDDTRTPPHEQVKRLYFDYESRDTLLRPLGTAFSISEDEAERRVLPIMHELATSASGKVLFNDPRRELGIIRPDDYQNPRSKRSDTWSAYLSRHGVMKLTGKLLDRASSGSSEHDYFTPSYLVRCKTSFAGENGKWRADRRRATPPDAVVNSELSKKAWLEEIGTIDPWQFMENAGGVVLWGRWTSVSGQLRRNVEVRTALVNQESAPALVRALRTVGSVHDYCIPAADGISEINHIGFVLRGWINEADPDGDIDSTDPWAGDLRTSLIMPAEFITDRLDLQRDKSGLKWFGHRAEVSMERQCWAEGERYGEREENNGDRLIATSSFVEDVIQKTNMAVLSEIRVQHFYGHGINSVEKENRQERTWVKLIGSTKCA